MRYGANVSGKTLSAWAKDSGAVGSLSSTSAANPYYTIGDGTNAVTLTSKTNVYCTSSDANCMQYYTFSSCTTSGSTLTDARDGNAYRVIKIGSLCWMRDNLKIMGVVTAGLSNFSGSDFDIAKGGSLTSGNTLTEPRATISTNSSYPGAYYNYCSVSAGTICTESSSTDGVSDICPSGWRLPTISETNIIGNIGGSTEFVIEFDPIYSGSYSGSSLTSVGSSGRWWTSSAPYKTDTARYVLEYGQGKLWSMYVENRQSGLSIRCVKST